MNEHRTSNPMATELRKWCGHDSHTVEGCKACEVADEIERLTAELAQAKKELLDTTWQDHADKWHQEAYQLRAERDRLRALLKEADDVIIDGGRHGRRVMHLRIEEALAGAADETTAVHSDAWIPIQRPYPYTICNAGSPLECVRRADGTCPHCTPENGEGGRRD